MSDKNQSKERMKKTDSTNFFDFLIALGGGIANLLKIEKIIALVILYLLYRDWIFVRRLPPNTDYQNYLIDTQIIEKIFESNNYTIIVLGCLVAVLTMLLVGAVIVIKLVYKKEIERLTNERHQILHNIADGNFEYLENHRTSEEVFN